MLIHITDQQGKRATKPAGHRGNNDTSAQYSPLRRRRRRRSRRCRRCRRVGETLQLALSSIEASPPQIYNHKVVKTKTGKIDEKQPAQFDSCDQCAFDRLCVQFNSTHTIKINYFSLSILNSCRAQA